MSTIAPEQVASGTPQAPLPVSSARASVWRRIARERWMYAFILPGFVFFVVFAYLPLLGLIPAKLARDEKRLREALRFLDFLWAPFGSVEDLVAWFGKEGVTYDLKDSFPVPRTDPPNASDVIGFAAWTAPFYYHSAAGRTPVEQGVSYCEKLVNSSVANPVAGIQSPASTRFQAKLKTLDQEYLNQIVSGRRPLADLAEYRQEWHKRGGDQIIADLRRGLDKTGG